MLTIQDDKLPDGKTCNDCAHWKRCSKLISCLDGTETHCDWAPSRFKEHQYQCNKCGIKLIYQFSLSCNCGGDIKPINESQVSKE